MSKEKRMGFRKLEANEIDCRIQSFKEGKGLSLLLYKDARVDQRILDEEFGMFGWQRHHYRDNRNCIVSIWDEEKKQWVEKEDTGTESNTEAEKGLASDSFKRACFNWGIGRELYSAPFIWVEASNFKNKYDKFSVRSIGYDENGDINRLEIYNETLRRVVYTLGKGPAKPEISNEKQKLIDDIYGIIEQKNFYTNQVLDMLKLSSFEDATTEQLQKAKTWLASK